MTQPCKTQDKVVKSKTYKPNNRTHESLDTREGREAVETCDFVDWAASFVPRLSCFLRVYGTKQLGIGLNYSTPVSSQRPKIHTSGQKG